MAMAVPKLDRILKTISVCRSRGLWNWCAHALCLSLCLTALASWLLQALQFCHSSVAAAKVTPGPGFFTAVRYWTPNGMLFSVGALLLYLTCWCGGHFLGIDQPIRFFFFLRLASLAEWWSKLSLSRLYLTFSQPCHNLTFRKTSLEHSFDFYTKNVQSL